MRADLRHVLVHDQDLDLILILPTFRFSQSDVQHSCLRCGRSDSRWLGGRLPHLHFPMQAFCVRLRQVYRGPLCRFQRHVCCYICHQCRYQRYPPHVALAGGVASSSLEVSEACHIRIVVAWWLVSSPISTGPQSSHPPINIYTQCCRHQYYPYPDSHGNVSYRHHMYVKPNHQSITN